MPKPTSDDDLDREIRTHLELEAEEHMAGGAPPDEARYAAARAFGNATRVKEVCYEMARVAWLERVIQDLRFAGRQMRKAPGFATAVILTLALGIGVNTGVFTLLYAVGLRPLPLKDADEIVNVFQVFPGKVSRSVNGSPDMLSYPEYLRYRDRNHSLSGLAAFADVRVSVGGAQTESGLAVLATCNYFQVLGVDMALGRALLPDECGVAGATPVAVLAFGFWQRRFSGDSAVLGKAVRLNRHAFTIVGVAPRDFAGTALGVPDVWVPVTMQPQLRERPALLEPNTSWLTAVGRLRKGVTISHARADLGLIARQADADYPGRETIVSIDPGAYLNGPQVRKQGLPIAAAILVVVGLVLVMACCNVMNLLLARAAARQREIGVRLSLGAGRARLVQQLLTEATALALAGGAVSLALAYWIPALLLQLTGQGDLPLNLAPDLHVFGYAFALSWAAALVFGLVPALWSTKIDLSSCLKQERSAGGRARASTLRSSLAAVQIAGSLLLLVLSALLIQGVRHAQTLTPGFATRDVLAISFDLPAQGYTPERAAAFYRTLRDRLAGVAGVESVAIAGTLPLLSRTSMGVTIGTLTDVPLFLNVVSGDYFRTMQVRLLRGRAFTDDQALASQVRPVVVSAGLARRFWPDGEEIGRRFGDAQNVFEVVGVAEDARNVNLGAPDAAFVYIAARPDNPLGLKIVLRAPGRAAAVASVIPDMTRALDSTVMVTTERFEDRLERVLQPSRAAALLAAVLGFFALVLALVGVYGVVSYSVSLRTHEMGIRMALGALPRDVVSLVVRQGARPLAAGLIAGALLAAGASQIIKGMLFGVSALDPLAYLATVGALSAAALLAMYAPARRAARVDPAMTLRFE
jgi:macrolide transport system ATP-binding/permease protein